MQSSKTLIWDLPTRVFHWLMVLAFALAWITHDDDRFLYFHVFAGYVFLGLLVFRLLWGVIGSHYSRFHSFAHDFGSVLEYVKALLNGRAMRYIGHNPAGGWAIFLMIAMGLIVALSGALALGGEERHGFLAGIIDFRLGIYAHLVHGWLAWAMLAVTAVHLLGVLVESKLHRENLIWTMISGRKQAEAESVGGIQRGHHVIGVTLLSLVILAALGYFRGYLQQNADDLYLPYKGPVLADNDTWRSECSDCHMAYHPSLLPKRSWQQLLAGQHEHFAEDLDLDDETIDELMAFFMANSAEQGLTEPSTKILFYTPADETPLRISETHYIKRKHAEIDEACWSQPQVLSRANCNACHLDAEQSTYEDSDMHLPSACHLD